MSEEKDKKSRELDEDNLDELREKVDKINLEIIKTIGKRFEITRKIGILKARENLSACDPNRENRVYNKIISIARDENLDEDMIKNIFKIIMEKVVEEHKKIKERENEKK